MGSYVVFIDTKATLHDAAAFQAPKAAGMQFHDVFGVWIAGRGGLDSVINGVGGPVDLAPTRARWCRWTWRATARYAAGRRARRLAGASDVMLGLLRGCC